MQNKKDYEPHFDGPAYVPERDFDRLTNQQKNITEYMESHDWVTLREVSEATGAPEASASSSIRNLRKARFGGRTVSRRYEGNGLFCYKLEPKEEQLSLI